MKKIILLFLALSLLSLLSGCAYYSKMAVPGEPAQEGKYEILKHIKTSVTGTRFLTIPLDIPSSAQIIKNEVSRLGGDGIINLEVTFSEFNLFVLSFPIVEVEGDVVKIARQLTNDSKILDPTSDKATESIVQKALPSNPIETSKIQNFHIDPAEFSKWKDKVLSSIKKSAYYWSWKSFEERNSIKISMEEWALSLPESEYVEYLTSEKSIDKWLGERLKR